MKTAFHAFLVATLSLTAPSLALADTFELPYTATLTLEFPSLGITTPGASTSGSPVASGFTKLGTLSISSLLLVRRRIGRASLAILRFIQGESVELRPPHHSGAGVRKPRSPRWFRG